MEEDDDLVEDWFEEVVDGGFGLYSTDEDSYPQDVDLCNWKMMGSDKGLEVRIFNSSL